MRFHDARNQRCRTHYLHAMGAILSPSLSLCERLVVWIIPQLLCQLRHEKNIEERHTKSDAIVEISSLETWEFCHVHIRLMQRAEQWKSESRGRYWILGYNL